MIQITVHGELILRLDQIPKKVRDAVGARFTELVEELYHKAINQLSVGTYDSTPEVDYGVDTQGSTLIGFMEPLTVKTKVQETGGKGWYPIVPIKSKLLKFMGREGKMVYTNFVFHPPVPGKHYIQNTIATNLDYVERELMRAGERGATSGR